MAHKFNIPHFIPSVGKTDIEKSKLEAKSLEKIRDKVSTLQQNNDSASMLTPPTVDEMRMTMGGGPGRVSTMPPQATVAPSSTPFPVAPTVEESKWRQAYLEEEEGLQGISRLADIRAEKEKPALQKFAEGQQRQEVKALEKAEELRKPWMRKADGTTITERELSERYAQAVVAGNMAQANAIERQQNELKTYLRQAKLAETGLMQGMRQAQALSEAQEAFKQKYVVPATAAAVYGAQKMPFSGIGERLLPKETGSEFERIADEYMAQGEGWLSSVTKASREIELPWGVQGTLELILTPENMLPVLGFPGLIAKPTLAAFRLLGKAAMLPTGISKATALGFMRSTLAYRHPDDIMRLLPQGGAYELGTADKHRQVLRDRLKGELSIEEREHIEQSIAIIDNFLKGTDDVAGKAGNAITGEIKQGQVEIKQGQQELVGTLSMRPAPAIGVAKLPKELAEAKPNYNIGRSRYTPRFESDVDKAFFIVSQTKKSTKDKSYMDWLREHIPNLNDAELRAAGREVRDHIKETVTGQPEGVVNIPSSPTTRDIEFNQLMGRRGVQRPPTPTIPPTAGAGIGEVAEAAIRIQKILDTPLPAYLDTATPRYGTFEIEFASGLDKAMFIIAKRKTLSKRDEEFIEYLQSAVPGVSRADILEAAGKISAHVGASIKAGSGKIDASEVAKSLAKKSDDASAATRAMEAENQEAVRQSLRRAGVPIERIPGVPIERIPGVPDEGINETIPLSSGPPRQTTPPPGEVDLPEPPSMSGAIKALDVARVRIKETGATILGDLIGRVHGLRSLRNWIYPRYKMFKHHHEAWVARRGAQIDIAEYLNHSRHQLIRDLVDEFGTKVVEGDEVSNIPFLGVQNNFPYIGYLIDIVSRPNLYKLTTKQKTLISRAQARNAKNLDDLYDWYGLEIPAFDVAEGSWLLPNVDVSPVALKGQAKGRHKSNSDLILESLHQGRLQERTHSTPYARWLKDKTFQPHTNVRLLVDAQDSGLTQAVGRKTFQYAIGGKNLMEVMQEVHPALTKRLASFQKRLNNLKGSMQRGNARVVRSTNKAIDIFNASSMEPGDGKRITPWDDLAKTLREIRNDLTEHAELQAEVDSVIAQIAEVRSALKEAKPSGYHFVQEGDIYRYFPSEEVEELKRLHAVSDNRMLQFLENWRNINLNFDLSPIAGVQAPLAILFNPTMVTGHWYRAFRTKKWSLQDPLGGIPSSLKRVFSVDALRDDAANDPLFHAFVVHTGRELTGTTAPEFSGGIIRKLNLDLGKKYKFLQGLPFQSIPLGRGYAKLNDGMFAAVTRLQKIHWMHGRDDLIKMGLTDEAANAVAGDMATSMIPMVDPVLMGQSASTAAIQRSLATSVSFLLKPVEFTNLAMQGFVKMGLLKTLTPREKLAVKSMTRLVSYIQFLSVSSAGLTAWAKGEDAMDAMMEAINPQSGKFMSLNLPGGSIALGGPYRSIFKSIVPRDEIDLGFGKASLPMPVPFAGIGGWLFGKVTPGVKTQLDLVENEDFYGNKIRTGELPLQIIQTLLYEIESALPLVAGTPLGGAIREGKGAPGELAIDTTSQFMGQNWRSTSPWQNRNKEVRKWATKNNVKGWEDAEIENFYDLGRGDRIKFEEEYPDIAERIKNETRRASDNGEEWAVRRVEWEDAVKKSQDEQQSSDEKLLNNEIDLKKWLSQRGDRRKVLQGKREGIYDDIDTDDPENPVDEYYLRIKELVSDNDGMLDEDGFFELEKWVRGLPADQQQWIDEHTGHGPSTDLEREYSKAMSTLRVYFDPLKDRSNIKRLLDAYPGISTQMRGLLNQYIAASPLKKRKIETENPELDKIIKDGESYFRQEIRSNYEKGALIEALLEKWMLYKPSTSLWRDDQKERALANWSGSAVISSAEKPSRVSPAPRQSATDWRTKWSHVITTAPGATGQPVMANGQQGWKDKWSHVITTSP